ncbi:hypothetical protein ACTXP3_27210, partial [Klebsiella pneumoniae]|uniref:hypothetical protein n=1 Tax=Klebsiella pneumoniae TaxID=573 RepID=UPI003FD3261B
MHTFDSHALVRPADSAAAAATAAPISEPVGPRGGMPTHSPSAAPAATGGPSTSVGGDRTASVVDDPTAQLRSLAHATSATI